MGFFGNNAKQKIEGSGFEYLDKGLLYFDSACQTLRPGTVIDAEDDYYHNYNACGGRVKYAWGEKVDGKVEKTRDLLLSYLRKSSKEYVVCFTTNTTYGINLVLNQFDLSQFKKIITSEIEHNSVFLPTIEISNRSNLERIVLERADDGRLIYEKEQLSNAIVSVNGVSNIDGRQLTNMKELVQDTHERGGIVCIDAAQAMVAQRDLLSDVEFDCLFGSSHKMYGPSLGFVVIKRELLKGLRPFIVGGGMVESVSRDSYLLINDESQLSSRLEPGLQNWAGIVGFGAALEWLIGNEELYKEQKKLAGQLYDGMKGISDIKILNSGPASVLAWYSDIIDAHKIALMYSAQGVMVRSGYFCCHYYLQQVKKLPPLVRISMGLNTTAEQVDRLLAITKNIISTFR